MSDHPHPSHKVIGKDDEHLVDGFDENEPSRSPMADFLRGIAFCAGGIFGFYLLYGYCQEKIFTYEYSIGKFKHADFIICFQFFISAMVGTLCLKLFSTSEDVNNPSQVTWTDKIIIGTLNSGTMLASNYALQFVGFPLQVLFKSCKAVPIMVVGLFRKSIKYELRQYFWAVLITVGLLCFQYNSFFNTKKSTGNWYGIGLLVVSLICDGFLGTQEDKLTKHKNATSFELMQASGIVGTVITAAIITLDGEWRHIFAFLQLKEFLKDFLVITVAGVLGQVFVYWTLCVHNSLVLSIVTTFRKLCAVFLSIYIFDHELHFSQAVGIAIVFSGIIVDIYFTKVKGGKHKGH